MKLWWGVLLLCILSVAICGCTGLSGTDQKFIQSSQDYLNAIKPVNEGSLTALKNHNNDDWVYYEKRGLDIDDKYLPILSGYIVSEKLQPIQDELILGIKDHRSAGDNYLKSVPPQDPEQKITYLNVANKNLSDATTHFEKVNHLIAQIKR